MAPQKHGSLRSTKSTIKATTLPTAEARTDNGIITLRYEETFPAKPPIPITVAPPRAPPTDLHPALRRPKSGEAAQDKGDERKRDSGLAPTTSSKARDGSVNTVEENLLGVTINFNSTPPQATAKETTMEPQCPPQARAVTPKKTASNESIGSGSTSPWRRLGSRKGSLPKTPSTTKSTEEDFSPITTPIPRDGFIDAGFLDSLSFSERGSVMLAGKKAVNGHARLNGGRR